MTNLDSILKSKDITLSTKVRLVKALVFPVVMHGCESWTMKKAECQRIDAFELWCWRRLLRVPWTARRSNQSILKEISTRKGPEGALCADHQFSSVAQSCPTLCDPMNRSTPGLPVHHQLPESTQTMSNVSVMPSNHLILCRPLCLPPSVFPSLTVFTVASVLHIRWPKDWSFIFNISSSDEYSGLISFRMDWLDLLALQGTVKSLLQHHSSKASILWCSAFFIVQLSHPYMTTGKTIALTRRTFVGKVISLLFNMLSRLVIALINAKI